MMYPVECVHIRSTTEKALYVDDEENEDNVRDEMVERLEKEKDQI
jgi:hypothetical protein